ncbi:hypothetical protein [Streptomyces sp. SID13726]|uniref:hypothetical protein n=1 Tax=Streptomyces sp. SID13726 TaxID=2706058 RepID=UPI0013B61D08|nr:hypothetical protein [Streptomyces sp. SID13726]NEB00902.1 hypothetical protein [Streptomyces sp. SID13726]
MLIQRHSPPVAEGEWTASVVHQVGFGSSPMSTAAVHRHRGGRMVEEYWFSGEAGRRSVTFTRREGDEVVERHRFLPAGTAGLRNGEGPGTGRLGARTPCANGWPGWG